MFEKGSNEVRREHVVMPYREKDSTWGFARDKEGCRGR